MDIERKKFKEIFEEDLFKENLTLLVDIKIKGTLYKKDTSFTSPSGLGGVDFHKFRYLDVGVKQEEDVYEIEGFFAQE